MPKKVFNIDRLFVTYQLPKYCSV